MFADFSNQFPLYWLVLLFTVLSFVGSIIVAAVVLMWLPADYFSAPERAGFWVKAHPGLRMLGLISKNLMGVFLVAMGLVMVLPGIPGQGLLTILVGILLLDFPGRRKLELEIIQLPRVLASLNWTRVKLGKKPFNTP